MNVQRADHGISVRDLVDAPELGITVLAGERGLSRKIQWAHVNELEHPWKWLDGGELLLTAGLGLPRTPSAQADYVRQLAHANAAGLGLGPRGAVRHRELFETADELDLPVLQIPFSTRFVAISRLVANANHDSARRRLVTHVSIFETLRLRDGRRLPPRELFMELGRLTGYRFGVVSPSGHAVFHDFPLDEDLMEVQLPPEDVDHAFTQGGYVLRVPVGGRMAGFLIAVPDHKREPAGLSAVQHVGTITALEIADIYRLREHQRRTGAEALSRLMTTRSNPDEARSMLQEAGLPVDQQLIFSRWRAPANQAIDEELHHRLADNAIEHAMLRVDTDIVALLPDAADQYATLAEDLKAVVGLSAPLGESVDLGLAGYEAAWALARTDAVQGQRLVRFGSSDYGSYFLPTDPQVLRQLVHHVLGDLETYDEVHNSELLTSLATYFRNHRKLSVSAQELFVHKHTLAYRLKRIEEITHRDLEDMQDTSELWLAIRARAIVRESGG
jgi:PucR family transcriptional regulator, purine catabolism regulatory protein